jgi:hypothetical protein
LLRVGALVEDLLPQVAESDCSPVLVHAEGARIVEAHIRAEGGARAPAQRALKPCSGSAAGPRRDQAEQCRLLGAPASNTGLSRSSLGHVEDGAPCCARREARAVRRALRQTDQ